MILTADMPNATNYEIRDSYHRMLHGVLKYDTDTQQVQMYLYDNSKNPVIENGVVKIITATLKGSYAWDRISNKKIV